jgi:hypothetical protein
MIRTQVSLDQDEYNSARMEAAALGISVAEFVRRAVREQLPVSGDAPWMTYAGFVASGHPHSSCSIDEMVLWREGLSGATSDTHSKNKS